MFKRALPPSHEANQGALSVVVNVDIDSGTSESREKKRHQSTDIGLKVAMILNNPTKRAALLRAAKAKNLNPNTLAFYASLLE